MRRDKPKSLDDRLTQEQVDELVAEDKAHFMPYTTPDALLLTNEKMVYYRSRNQEHYDRIGRM